MQGKEAQAENFVSADEVSDISAGEIIPAGVAVAIFFEGSEIVGEGGVLHNEAGAGGSSGRNHSHTVTGDAGWENAVEHIDAAQDAFEQMVGSADTHQIARLILWQIPRRNLKHIVHNIARFADAQSANCAAVEVHTADNFGAFFAQVRENAPLADTKNALIGRSFSVETALSPAVRAFGRFFGVVVIGGIGNAFVERHSNIGAERHLSSNGNFGRKKFWRAVEVRAESYAVLSDFAQFAEAENLEAAAVSQNTARPVHKFVQAARLLNQIRARA